MSKTIPEELIELLEIKPSAYQKLNLVFHDLSLENQIKIIKYKKKSKKEIAYLLDNFFLTALKSKYEYIRYLVAEDFYFYDLGDGLSNDEIEIEKLIKNDKSELVRNTLLEKTNKYDFDKEFEINSFLKLSQQQRLAKISKVTDCFEGIANLFKKLAIKIKSKKISELEVFEILLEYSKNKNIEDSFLGMRSYEYTQIWETVNIFNDNISGVLVKNLPLNSIHGPDEKTIENMSNRDLSLLFEREDFKEEKVRNKYFIKFLNNYKESSDKFPYDLDNHAYFHYFKFDSESYNLLLNLKDRGKDIVDFINRFSSNLTLINCIALRNIININNFIIFSDSYLDRTITIKKKIRDFKNHKIGKSEFQTIKMEIAEAQIFELALSLFNDFYYLDDKFKAFKNNKKDSLWDTYESLLKERFFISYKLGNPDKVIFFLRDFTDFEEIYDILEKN